MLEQCFIDQGKGARCLICPLARANCPRVLTRLQRLQRDSRNQDYKVNEPDRQTLLQETLNAVIRRVDKALKGPWDIEHIGAYTSSVFKKKRASYYSKAPRFGDWSSVGLHTVPQGLYDLVARHAGVLQLEGKTLAATAMMPRSLHAELAELSADDSWQKSIGLLYTNTWKGVLTEGEALTEGLPAQAISNPEEVLVQKQRWQTALSPYLKLWTLIDTEQAKNCAELFSEFGRDIVSDDSSDRNVVATTLKVQENTLNKRVSRCYALIHEYLANLLAEMAGEEPRLCLRLFTQVYGGVGQGLGLQQRLDKAAAAHGVSRETINIWLRHCRRLIMVQLEW